MAETKKTSMTKRLTVQTAINRNLTEAPCRESEDTGDGANRQRVGISWKLHCAWALAVLASVSSSR